MSISSFAGRGAGRVYMPSGSSTPRRREYSRAEALLVRGEYEGAIIAFETAILEDPTDPEPYLRIARLYRDRLEAPEEALQWFRRGLEEAEVSDGQEVLVRREMAELMINRLGEPRRAAPELARLAETFPDTGAGRWAREELAKIKEEMAREE
jgi:tetratricopeptide (TPR) repeat protein